jgi:hypothetical protein
MEHSQCAWRHDLGSGGAGARIVKLLRLTHVDGLVTLLPEAEPEAKVVAVGVA